jgi:hypothetical protein
MQNAHQFLRRGEKVMSVRAVREHTCRAKESPQTPLKIPFMFITNTSTRFGWRGEEGETKAFLPASTNSINSPQKNLVLGFLCRFGARPASQQRSCHLSGRNGPFLFAQRSTTWSANQASKWQPLLLELRFELCRHLARS